MQNYNISDLIAVGSLIFTAIGGIVTAAFWYAKAEKRKYGLERDFAHLKINYQQIQVSLNTILTEFDHRFDNTDKEILQIKADLNYLRKEG